jgi:hypothetical protein
MKLLQKLAAAAFHLSYNRSTDRVPSNEESYIYGYEDGFKQARDMAANFLGPPWPYAIFNTSTDEITWDREGIDLIKSCMKLLGEEEA